MALQSRLYSLVARRLSGSLVGTTEPPSHPNEYDDKCTGLLTNTRSNLFLRSKISKSHLGTHAFRLKLLKRHKTKAYFWT